MLSARLRNEQLGSERERLSPPRDGCCPPSSVRTRALILEAQELLARSATVRAHWSGASLRSLVHTPGAPAPHTPSVNDVVEGRRGDRRRSMSGSDRCFASLNALACGDPRVVGPRRSPPASLCATQPPQSAFRQHSLPRVCHAGVHLHIGASGPGDLELSSTRIEERHCAKRSPTSAVLPLRPSG